MKVLAVLLGAVALFLALIAWRSRKWRVVGRDRYTKLGRVKRVPLKRNPHEW